MEPHCINPWGMDCWTSCCPVLGNPGENPGEPSREDPDKNPPGEPPGEPPGGDFLSSGLCGGVSSMFCCLGVPGASGSRVCGLSE